MKIVYFSRHPKVGHSIQRVFRTIVEEVSKTNEVSVITMPCTKSMPWDIYKNNKFTAKHKDTKAVHHITGHIHEVILALTNVKTVLTIHDLVFIDNINNPLKRIYKWFFWLYLPSMLADRVVCISHQTKNNLLKKLNIEKNKLSVIYNPVDPIFKFSYRKFNEQQPIILHIGTGWNKNLENTIKALEGISCHLRIIGELNRKYDLLLAKYKINYSSISNLTDAEMYKEYEGCDIVNFVSIYEGFGMPIIEGQATGRAVVTSRIEPMIEVSNDAVYYINPRDVKSISDGYVELIRNKSLRENIIKLGLENVKRFEAKFVSEQYENIYKSI